MVFAGAYEAIHGRRLREMPTEDGWYPFGTHIDRPGLLEFSEELDEALMPKYERPLRKLPIGTCERCL